MLKSDEIAEVLNFLVCVIQEAHSQLADELGSVREVISRILENFETNGLVELERNQVQIIDQEALTKIARLV